VEKWRREVSFDLPSLLIGLIPGMIIGHCTRCRFTCPNGDQGKGGFWCRCNDRALKDALKPDANFDAAGGGQVEGRKVMKGRKFIEAVVVGFSIGVFTLLVLLVAWSLLVMLSNWIHQ
jgi:hypothetical protein